MQIPILYMVAIQPNDNIIQNDGKVYKTEKGVERSLKQLEKQHKNGSQFFIIYAEDFKRA